MAFIGVNVEKSSFLFTEGGSNWSMFSLNDDIGTDPLEPDDGVRLLHDG